MIWHHSCNWFGESKDLTPAYYQGILYSYVCPKCGAEWPFFYEDDDLEPDPEPDYILRNRDIKKDNYYFRVRSRWGD